MTNQRYASSAPGTSFSPLLKICNRGTVSRFDAFCNIAFRNVLKYQLALPKKMNVQRMCIDLLYSRGSYKLGHRHQGRHRCPLPFWHR